MDKAEVKKILTEVGEILIHILPENWRIFLDNNIDGIYAKAEIAGESDDSGTGLTEEKIRALTVVVFHDFMFFMKEDLKNRLRATSDLYKHRN